MIPAWHNAAPEGAVSSAATAGAWVAIPLEVPQLDGAVAARCGKMVARRVEGHAGDPRGMSLALHDGVTPMAIAGEGVRGAVAVAAAETGCDRMSCDIAHRRSDRVGTHARRERD